MFGTLIIGMAAAVVVATTEPAHPGDPGDQGAPAALEEPGVAVPEEAAPAEPDAVASPELQVDVNLPDLAWLADGRVELLRRFLASHPDWRVEREHRQIRQNGQMLPLPGDIVAVRCDRSITLGKQSGGTISNGYESFGEIREERPGTRRVSIRPEGQRRMLFRFADEATAQGGYQSRARVVVSPTAGVTALKVGSYLGTHSTLVVGQRGVWVELFESVDVKDRAQTRAMLGECAELLAAVRAGEAELREKGFIAALMPEDGVRHGKASLSVAPVSNVQTRYEGWFNPGEAGMVFLRVFSAETGEAWSPAMVRADSVEDVGWSSDPGTLFRFSGGVTIREIKGSWDSRHRARFEAWFRADDDGEERKLLEVEAVIAGWEP